MAEDAEDCPNSAMGGTWVGEGGGGVSLQLILIMWPQAVRQMRGVGGGRRERRGGMGQITARSNPHSSFSLFFFLLCVRRGFDEKILHLAVQYNPNEKRGGFTLKFHPKSYNSGSEHFQDRAGLDYTVRHAWCLC